MSTKRLTLSIRGLTCACCVARVEQAMRQQEGVIWATINFAAEEASVLYDSSTFDSARLVQVASRLGYQVVLSSSQFLELETTLPIRRRLLQTGSWGGPGDSSPVAARYGRRRDPASPGPGGSRRLPARLKRR